MNNIFLNFYREYAKIYLYTFEAREGLSPF